MSRTDELRNAEEITKGRIIKIECQIIAERGEIKRWITDAKCQTYATRVRN